MTDAVKLHIGKLRLQPDDVLVITLPELPEGRRWPIEDIRRVRRLVERQIPDRMLPDAIVVVDPGVTLATSPPTHRMPGRPSRPWSAAKRPGKGTEAHREYMREYEKGRRRRMKAELAGIRAARAQEGQL